MCGILAQFNFDKNKPVDRTKFQAALSRMQNRGPDNHGVHYDSGVAVGMRRLSIIDVAGSNQPISNVSNNLHIVCNGEIYNFESLRSALKGRGRIFKTKGDVEPLLHLYEEICGTELAFSAPQATHFLRQINGMFAFAIFDSRNRRLLVARDRAGIKPLYFSRNDSSISFSSEINPLVEIASGEIKPDPEQLPEFLRFGYLLGRNTGFSGIQRVLPGEAFVIDDNGVSSFSFWSAQDAQKCDELPKKVEELLPTIISEQLISDVGAGLFLSGGLDSSLLASVISRDLGRKIPCFTLTFQDPSHDESLSAETLASRLELPLQKISMSTPSIETVSEAISIFTEPFGDMSVLPTAILSKNSVSAAKVVLSGDGGDELFGGYPTHFLTGYHSAFRWATPFIPHSLISKLHTGEGYLSRVAKLKAFTRGITWDPVDTHFGWKTLFQNADSVLNDYEPRSQSDPLIRMKAEWSTFPSSDPVTKAGWLDFISFLPDDVLQKTDRITMHYSQEARVPFLDNRLIDVALLAPRKERGALFNTKVLFRKLMKEKYKMPKSIWNKPKRGFTPPLASWIHSELGTWMKRSLLDCPFYDKSTVESLFQEQLMGKEDHSRRIWSLLVAKKWLTGKLE